jgi:hypothetical protein
MLGMKVSGSQVKPVVVRLSSGFREDGTAICITETRINDQRRAIADDDPDIRNERDVLIEYDGYVFGDLFSGIRADQRVGRCRLCADSCSCQQTHNQDCGLQARRTVADLVIHLEASIYQFESGFYSLR